MKTKDALTLTKLSNIQVVLDTWYILELCCLLNCENSMILEFKDNNNLSLMEFDLNSNSYSNKYNFSYKFVKRSKSLYLFLANDLKLEYKLSILDSVKFHCVEDNFKTSKLTLFKN
jgi:hypothetical protein